MEMSVKHADFDDYAEDEQAQLLLLMCLSKPPRLRQDSTKYRKWTTNCKGKACTLGAKAKRWSAQAPGVHAPNRHAS